MSDQEIDGQKYYVLLQFERPVILNTGALYIASKLDTDIHANICRLAFYGNILWSFTDKNYVENDLQNLKIFKIKNKEGIVERVSNEYEVIAKNLFKKETNIQNFVGLKVSLSTGEEGFIDGCFGQSGKVKIRIPSGIKDQNLLTKFKRANNDKSNTQIKVLLQFKRFIYDSHKKMIQI
jgi:selenocysteine-specific elongation factor